jgi:hypothetical protein
MTKEWSPEFNRTVMDLLGKSVWLAGRCCRNAQQSRTLRFSALAILSMLADPGCDPEDYNGVAGRWS